MRTVSPLFEAIDRNDAMALRRMLVQSPDLVCVRDETRPLRPYPLHAAASRGQVPMLKILLSAGADPDSVDAGRTSALGMACIYGHVEVVKALLSAGANPNLRNDLGFAPLTAATAGAQGRWRHYASSSTEDWASIAATLLAHGAQT